jgi:general secretion pathway protein D
MRNSWAQLARSASLAVIAASAAMASAQQASDVRVDVNLKDADMVLATRTLTARAGVDFVFEQSSEPYSKVTLKLDGVTAEDAVRYVCQAAGAYFRRDENGVYIISHHPPVQKDVEPAHKAPRILKRVKVLKADVRDVYDEIYSRIPFDYARGFEALQAFSGRYGGLGKPMATSTITVLPGNNPANLYNPVNPTVSTPGTSSESGGDIKLPGAEGGKQVGGFGGGGQGFGGGGQGFGGGGQGFGGGGQGFGGGGQNGGGQLVPGQGLVPSDIDFISFDPTDNSLLVRGTEEAINQLQTYISTFDVAPKQVIVKVEYITTTANLQKALGYEFLYQRATVLAGSTPGVFADQSLPVFFNYASGNIVSRLRTKLLMGDGKVVNSPILRTLNNQPAQLTINTSEYVDIPQTIISNGTAITQPNITQINIPTFLSITPRINDDNTVTMYLQPQISTIVGVSQTSAGALPNVVQQFMSVVARVRNGETMVLGGLTQKSTTNSEQRIPVLGDLPLVGQFFRSYDRSQVTSELLVFVTPTVLDDDGLPSGTGGP